MKTEKTNELKKNDMNELKSMELSDDMLDTVTGGKIAPDPNDLLLGNPNHKAGRYDRQF